jgi:hypothetical protein
MAIDIFSHSRMVYQAVHRRENADTHSWVFQNYLKSVQRLPSVVVTDRHQALVVAIKKDLPQARHIFCIHHIASNLKKNLSSRLGSVGFEAFQHDFWAAYRSVSPEAFDIAWRSLFLKYPAAENYLQAELYPCRSQWAYAWVAPIFTAGTRTTGRMESENRINKLLGNAKTTLLQLFNNLNGRIREQSTKELITVREVSKWKHFVEHRY